MGSSLAKLRGERNATVEEMAAALDIEPQLLAAIEKGQARASAQLLMRVSVRLNVPTSYFYG